MVEIRHILCPVDFSDTSKRALQYARALAGRYGSKLTALHVMPLHMPPLSALASAAAATFEPDVRDRLQADLHERLDNFVAPYDGRIKTLVVEGDVANQIATLTRALHVDLVVQGTFGHSSLERLALGSTTDKTLRKASCPVMVVPPDVAPQTAPLRFRRILCATDFSESARRALDYAFALAEKTDGRVTLLHVLEPLPAPMTARARRKFDVEGFRHALEEEAHDRLRHLVPDGAETRLQGEDVRFGKPFREILEVAEHEHADLVAMGVQGHGPLADAFFGSTAYNVARRASCPVLTARPRAA
jgi:nucleotide-binding universal stress UspA family protein